MTKLCEDKVYVSKLCVDKLCVSKFCDDKLCVSKLCVSKLCVDKLCEDKRRREEATGYRTKNKNPTQRCGEKGCSQRQKIH